MRHPLFHMGPTRLAPHDTPALGHQCGGIKWLGARWRTTLLAAPRRGYQRRDRWTWNRPSPGALTCLVLDSLTMQRCIVCQRCAMMFGPRGEVGTEYHARAWGGGLSAEPPEPPPVIVISAAAGDLLRRLKDTDSLARDIVPIHQGSSDRVGGHRRSRVPNGGFPGAARCTALCRRCRCVSSPASAHCDPPVVPVDGLELLGVASEAWG